MRQSRAERRQRGARNRAAAKERREGTCGAFKREMDRLERERFAERVRQQLERKLDKPVLRPMPGRPGIGLIMACAQVVAGGDEKFLRAMGLDEGVEGVIDKMISGDIPTRLEVPCSPKDELEEAEG